MPTSMPTEIESDISMNSFPYPPSIAENESIDPLPQGADNSANDLRQVGAVSSKASLKLFRRLAKPNRSYKSMLMPIFTFQENHHNIHF